MKLQIYLTTGTRQPVARNLYLKTGYTPLFDIHAPAESLQLWPFEKVIVPVKVKGPCRSGLRDQLTSWKQQRALKRVWTLPKQFLRRRDDLIAEPASSV